MLTPQLKFIHQGHLGIVKCHIRENQTWWVGFSTQIKNLVRNCRQCVERCHNIKESMLLDEFPQRPFQKIPLDVYKVDFCYLIITDYYTRFDERFKLTKMAETLIISKKKYFQGMA